MPAKWRTGCIAQWCAAKYHKMLIKIKTKTQRLKLNHLLAEVENKKHAFNWTLDANASIRNTWIPVEIEHHKVSYSSIHIQSFSQFHLVLHLHKYVQLYIFMKWLYIDRFASPALDSSRKCDEFQCNRFTVHRTNAHQSMWRRNSKSNFC